MSDDEEEVGEAMHVQMYSIREFPKELRCHFEIPGDPYDEEDPSYPKVIAFLRKLGVVFYRDTDNVNGVIIEPDNAVLVPIEDQAGFVAYYSHVILDADSMEVQKWETPTKKILKKNGDDRMWLEWNRRVTVSRITPGVVVRS